MGKGRFMRCNECRALNEPRALFCSRCGASLYGPVHGKHGPRRRRFTVVGAAMGVALLLALAVVTFALGLIVYRSLDKTEEVDSYSGLPPIAATIESTSTSAAGGDSQTTTTLAPIQVRPTAAKASSTRKATSTNSYRATNLIDGDLTTAWSEGVRGPGPDEWVRFEFSEPQVIARMEIANGHQIDEERFQDNPRIKSMKVEYSNGVTQLVELADVTGYQIINATSEAVEWVRFTIVSVHAGDQTEYTSLSEVRIFAKAS